MINKIVLFVIGAFVGVFICYGYMSKKIVRITDNCAMVGNFIINDNNEYGPEILEIDGSNVIIRHSNFSKYLGKNAELIRPQVLDVVPGDVVQLANIDFTSNSFSAKPVFYIFDGEKMVRILQ